MLVQAMDGGALSAGWDLCGRPNASISFIEMRDLQDSSGMCWGKDERFEKVNNSADPKFPKM